MKRLAEPLQKGRTTLYATDRPGSVLAQLHSRQPGLLAYTPFGYRPPASWPGFNGQLPDPLTGHYLLGNGYRAYNPVLMRFNSPDSLSPFGKGGMNAYAYCAGDPVNRHDSTGHISSPHLLRMTGVKGRVMPRSIPLLKGNGLGDLEVFAGTPHVLDSIVSHLSGDDLVSLSLVSKKAQGVVRYNVHPVPHTSADKLNSVEVSALRTIALGQARHHIPAQVLKWQNLREMALQLPATDIPMQETTLKLNYIRALRQREQR